MSFSSVDTIVNDNESCTESHSCHSNNGPHDKLDQIQQLEQTVQRLQHELQQQAHDHALEQMGDKARIDYLLTMMNHTDSADTRFMIVPKSPQSFRKETSDNDKDNLHVALELSEQGRIRAVQELHQERELYAQKIQQLMRLVVQQEEEQQMET